MEKNTTSRLTLKQKIGYGCGDAGGLFTFSLMSAFPLLSEYSGRQHGNAGNSAFGLECLGCCQ